MFGSVRKALPNIREALPNVRELLRGPHGCPGVVGRPFRMSGSVLEVFPNVRERSGDPPGRSKGQRGGL